MSTTTGDLQGILFNGAQSGEYSQPSTDVETVVAGSFIDCGVSASMNRNWSFKNNGAHSIIVTQYFWTREDRADRQNDNQDTVASGAFDNFKENQGRFSELTITSAVAGQPGSIIGGWYTAT